MKSKKKRYIVLIGIVVILIGIFLFSGRSNAEKLDSVAGYNPDSIPMLDTDSVTMLISDSGIVKFKIITKTWLMFDRTKNPHWLFPDKFYLEQYDTTFQVVATIVADSVWNYTNRKLWKLRGNVQIENIKGEVFTSNELFWDQRKRKFYSNELVEILQPSKMTIRGRKGFESNEQMTEYTFTDVFDTDIFVKESSDDKEIKE